MLKKELGRLKRHGRIRKKISGTPERPRLAVHRSAKNLYLQIIDDMSSRTLFSFSTRDKQFQNEKPGQGKVEAAKKLGQYSGKHLKEKGIVRIAFDRSGYLYHGRIKALADSLRESGLEF